MFQLQNDNSDITSETKALPQGLVLDQRYLLKSKIQEGHTSELYLATDLATKKEVAVKKIHKEYVKETKDEV